MFFRKFNLLIQDVILVGAGGTGSRVIAPLIQTLKQAQSSLNPCLYIVDGDIFENKNLARQNCIAKDMGRNKAIVMAERYGPALDFPVAAHPETINPGGDMITEIGNSATEQGVRKPLNTRRLIILCVDNVQARLNIISQAGPKDIIIDAGNEDTFGQVSIFDKLSIPHMHGRVDATDLPEDIKPFSGEYELPFIPSPISMYLDSLVNPPKATGSCADLDQSLAINNLMAAGIINLVQNLVYNNKFYCRTSYFDLIKGNSSERMTPVWFNGVMKEELKYPNRDITNYTSAYGHSYTSLISGLYGDISSNVNFINPALLAAIRG